MFRKFDLSNKKLHFSSQYYGHSRKGQLNSMKQELGMATVRGWKQVSYEMSWGAEDIQLAVELSSFKDVDSRLTHEMPKNTSTNNHAIY